MGKHSEIKKARKRKALAYMRHYNNKVKFLESKARKLRQTTPKSEIWFYELYKPYKSEKDKFNHVFFNTCIPDVLNLQDKYVIEVDGSIHEQDEIKKKDIIKNKRYFELGFKVFRIVAYSEKSFVDFVEELLQYREYINKLKGNL